MLTAIIVAGGSSQRMGFDKTFALLASKPVVAHSVAAFDSAECVADIIVVGRRDSLEQLRDVLASSAFRKLRTAVAGGVHRQDSVAEGLKHVGTKSNFIAVHDAARPLVTPSAVARVYAAAREHGAASLAAPVVDTLKRADNNCVVSGSVDRDNLYAMQTPQIFSRELLVNAYRRVAENSIPITDEVSALEAFGQKVVLVPNDDFNFKITFPRDLELAGLVLAQRQGSDLH